MLEPTNTFPSYSRFPLENGRVVEFYWSDERGAKASVKTQNGKIIPIASEHLPQELRAMSSQKQLSGYLIGSFMLGKIMHLY